MTENTLSMQTTASLSSGNQGHISVLYMNARFLIPKRDGFLAQIATEKPDIIAITESWANSSHLMVEFAIAGYESYQKNRAHKKGGGVICYFKSTLSAVEIKKQDAQNYDSVYVELANGNKEVTVATIYRPPKQQLADDAALYEEIQTTILNKNAVVIGDFNCPNINWNLMHGDQEGNRLVEMVKDSFLPQLVTQPTRGNNILDLVLTTDTDLVSECEVGEILSGCDHHMIWLRISTNHQLAENKSKVPDYRHANFDCAREMLPPETWAHTSITSGAPSEITLGGGEDDSPHEMQKSEQYHKSTMDDRRNKKGNKLKKKNSNSMRETATLKTENVINAASGLAKTLSDKANGTTRNELHVRLRHIQRNSSHASDLKRR